MKIVRTVQSIIELKRAEPVVLSSNLGVDPVGLLPVHRDELFSRHNKCQPHFERSVPEFLREQYGADIEDLHQSCAHEWPIEGCNTLQELLGSD